MELKDLCGLHWLTGVKLIRFEDTSLDGRDARCCANLELDGKCFTVVWDEIDHGHHTAVDVPLHESVCPFRGDRFPALQVVGTMDDSLQRKMMYFVDVINGNRVLSIGHDSIAGNTFTVVFSPERAAKNLMILDKSGNLCIPGEWIVSTAVLSEK